VHAIKLTSADKADNDAALAEVQKVAGRLDVVIANAGASAGFAATGEVPLGSMRADFEVWPLHHQFWRCETIALLLTLCAPQINVLGPLSLFQSAYPLLKASAQPKFIIVSSNAGSIELGPAMPIKMVAYGVSKAGVNWLAAKLWHEYPPLGTSSSFPVKGRTRVHDIDVIPQYSRLPHPPGHGTHRHVRAGGQGSAFVCGDADARPRGERAGDPEGCG